MLRTIVVIISMMMVLAGLGCATLSHLITPAEVNQNALQYAVDAGVADQNDYDAWYPNLDEATRLKIDVDSAHILNREELQHLIEKDNTQHGIHQKVTTSNYATAVQREEILFGETGLLSLGLSMAGFGSLTGLLGLTRKRPGDITAPEMEQALATATGKTSAELSVKEKQFVQVIKGVQSFIDSGPAGSDVALLKSELMAAQDKDTEAAVAVVKKLS